MVNKNEMSDQIDIGGIFALVWRRKWLLIIPGIVATGIAFASTFFLTPQFESNAIIQVSAKVNLIGEVKGLVGQQDQRQTLQVKQDKIRSIYNEIISAKYLSLLDERLNLTSDPDIENRALAYVTAAPEVPIERAKLFLLQSDLKDNIAVSWASGDQIRIIVQSEKAILARDIANTLGDIFIAEKVKEELSQIRSSQDFSDIQLNKYEEQLENLKKQKLALEKEIIGMQIDESISSESNILEISDEIDDTEDEILNYRGQEANVTGQLRNIDGIEISKLKLSESNRYKETKAELNDQLKEIGSLMIRYTWSNPQVINYKVKLNNYLNTLNQEINQQVDRQYNSFSSENRLVLKQLFDIRAHLDHLYVKKPYLESALDELTTKIKLVPERQAEVDRLEGEIQSVTDYRDRFKRQQESSSISQALVQDLSNTKYRVVEPAKMALTPFAPDHKKIIVMGLVLGLVLGGVAILLIELLDKSYKTVEDVEKNLELPVIGIVPKIDVIKKLK